MSIADATGTRFCTLAIACVLGACLGPAGVEVASGEIEIAEFDGTVTDRNGDPATQAGSHPFAATTRFRLVDVVDPAHGLSWPSEDLRDASIDFAPGFINDAQAAPTCTQAQLTTDACPPESQIGTASVYYGGLEGGPTGAESTPSGVYNMLAPTGAPALLAFRFFGTPAQISIRLRTGEDYGISAVVRNVAQSLTAAPEGARLTIWGIPSDPDHDSQRFCPGTPSTPGCPSGDHPRPFLTLPTSCAGPVLTSIEVKGWYGGLDEAGFLSNDGSSPTPNPVGAVGCNAVDFSPALQARPTTEVADAPSGLDFELSLPRHDGCVLGPPVSCETAEAALKDATIELPPGFVANPAAANGLGACSPTEFGLLTPVGSAPYRATPDPVTCPDASRLGTAEIESQLVDHPLRGSIYLAEPFENPFASRLAVYLAIDDQQSGLAVKLAGEVRTDPFDGRLSVSFEDNPQLPFEELSVHLFGGVVGPLRTPMTCGFRQSTSELTPWTYPDSSPASPMDFFAIRLGQGGRPCPESDAAVPFAPLVEIGSVDPIAAAQSPLVVDLRRADGTEEMAGLSIELPPGVVSSIAGVARCPDTALSQAGRSPGIEERADPACQSASRVGGVNVAVGAGPTPHYLSGDVYLTGPYKGAPLGIAIVVPALAGPFDLGTVVLRNRVFIDSQTARLRAVSDPFPRFLDGIPLDLRRIELRLDRPGFIRNPTSCDPMAVGALVTALDGATTDLYSRFQVGDCDALGFRPSVSMMLSGALARNGHPSLKAVLRAKPGQAAIARAALALPVTELLEYAGIRDVCSRASYAAAGGGGERCPPASRYGYARVFTQLLDRPLEGPLYLRSNDGQRRLPDLVASLGGESGLHLDLVAHTSSAHGLLRETFVGLPDMPLSRVVLWLRGGRHGLLANTTDLCSARPRAWAGFLAHNGKTRAVRPAVRIGCSG